MDVTAIYLKTDLSKLAECVLPLEGIRDFLGHEDISTTQIYSRADNRLKNEAINSLAPKLVEKADLPDWRTDQDLLGFLNSFR